MTRLGIRSVEVRHGGESSYVVVRIVCVDIAQVTIVIVMIAIEVVTVLAS